MKTPAIVQETTNRITELMIAGQVSAALIALINRVCDQAEDHGAGAIVVLRLRGGLQNANGAPDIHLVTQWERALRRLERLPALTIAAAEGRCTAAQFAALVVADHRIGAGSLRLSLSDEQGAILPAMVLYRVAHEVGGALSRRLALFGGALNATDALNAGLLDELVVDVDAAIAAFIESTGEIDTSDLAVRRQLLLEAPARTFEDALGTHLAACDRAFRRGVRRNG